MKHPVTVALLIIVGCILITGCIEILNKNTTNTTTPALLAPISDSDQGEPSTTNNTSILKGPLTVSIGGFPANIAVVLDNKTVGTAKPATPLNLMVTEGNHSVMVCVGWVCEHDNVSIRFGRQVTVDFGERLLKDVEFPNATARILEYHRNGNGISVNVEFINPETVDHTIFVELSAGYSYIDDRSQIKHGDLAKSITSLLVKAGDRQTKRVNLYFTSSGSSFNFDYPVISDLNVK